MGEGLLNLGGEDEFGTRGTAEKMNGTVERSREDEGDA